MDVGLVVAEGLLVTVTEGLLVTVTEGLLVTVTEGLLVTVTEGLLVTLTEEVLDDVALGKATKDICRNPPSSADTVVQGVVPHG
jgi:hypothetical protein